MLYYTLVSSLPTLPRHFDVEHTHIRWARIAPRLSMLSDEDAQVLRQLNDFLAWDRQPPSKTDEEVVSHFEEMRRSISDPTVLEIATYRIRLRTIVAALRNRRDGLGPPAGVGRILETVRTYWDHPTFRLQRRRPWISELAQRLVGGDVMATERLLYDITWEKWTRMSDKAHAFSLPRVLLYLAKWSILDRWVSRDPDVGRARFDALLQEALDGHA